MIRTATANSIATNISRATATVSGSIRAMARVATMPSSARPTAAARPMATPARVRALLADESASNAVSAAPTPAAVTPSQAIRFSLWPSTRRASRAPNTG